MSTNQGGGAAAHAAGMIEEACARNLSLQLHYDSPEGEQFVARSRLLGADGRFVYLDSPQAIGESVSFNPGQQVEGHLLVNDVRYSFKTMVAHLRCKVQINEQKTVVGMVLNRPAALEQTQRRSSFRVSLLGDDPVTTELHVAGAGDGGASPIDAHHCHGELVNLSVGGAGLRLSCGDARPLGLRDPIFLSFELPGEADAFVFLAEIRQMRAINDGEAVRLGLKLKSWPSKRDLERTQHRLQHYLTALQRAKLKRTA